MRHKKVLGGFKDANVKKPILVLSQAILRVFTSTLLQILSKFFTFSDNQNNFKFQYILTSHYKCKIFRVKNQVLLRNFRSNEKF